MVLEPSKAIVKMKIIFYGNALPNFRHFRNFFISH